MWAESVGYARLVDDRHIAGVQHMEQLRVSRTRVL